MPTGPCRVAMSLNTEPAAAAPGLVIPLSGRRSMLDRADLEPRRDEQNADTGPTSYTNNGVRQWANHPHVGGTQKRKPPGDTTQWRPRQTYDATFCDQLPESVPGTLI